MGMGMGVTVDTCWSADSLTPLFSRVGGGVTTVTFCCKFG
ncbi:hypothetical protein CWATWH0402_4668 [Crocosphaera watsonii WH 0402]|uniref:Uncharacterized protein n=1 Tax=Crocosphaera watsonii WH 0402 TaxID=1284629 RepID=T2JLZ1_CROWT|nr:hypothetical protein CWATWH0402_4668 [Crocosphaera watsonii WH 0402]